MSVLLSIITINYNNAEGLQKTLDSVLTQTYHNFRHIIIDGASTDSSVEIIKSYTAESKHQVDWLSEPDSGIYNAMNKGIRLANSDYVQILNSGDILASDTVIERMTSELTRINKSDEILIPILYGNMLKDFGNGKIIKDTCGSDTYTPDSFLYFYNGTLNHDCTYIRRDLFDKYGYYNEEMKICSDWEWYVRTIIFGKEKTQYVNIDVTIFDMFGVSESNGKNKDIIKTERRQYLESVILPSVLHDYNIYSAPISQYLRLKEHHLWPLITFVERVLFKLEKWKILK